MTHMDYFCKKLASRAAQLQEEKVKLGDAEAPENLDPTLNIQVERVIDEAFVRATGSLCWWPRRWRWSARSAPHS